MPRQFARRSSKSRYGRGARSTPGQGTQRRQHSPCPAPGASMRSLIVPVIVLSSALLMACEEGPKPPLKTAFSPPGQGAGEGAQATWMAPKSAVTRGDTGSLTAGSIQIDERILKACGDLPT